jgi:hypothetical protein
MLAGAEILTVESLANTELPGENVMNTTNNARMNDTATFFILLPTISHSQRLDLSRYSEYRLDSNMPAVMIE